MVARSSYIDSEDHFDNVYLFIYFLNTLSAATVRGSVNQHFRETFQLSTRRGFIGNRSAALCRFP